jgi:hypothetical protein
LEGRGGIGNGVERQHEIPGKAFAKLGAGAFQTFAEAGFGDIEVSGGVGPGLAVEVEAIDGALESIGKFAKACFEDFEDGGISGDPVVLPCGDSSIEILDMIRWKRLAFFSARPFAVFVADETAHPGAEVAGDIKVFDFPVCGHEGLLDNILGGFVVTGEGAGVDEEFAVVLADEDGEGLAIGEKRLIRCGDLGRFMGGHDGGGSYEILAIRGGFVTFLFLSG